jgi:hypothetical protein
MNGMGKLDWYYLVRDRDQWWTLMNAVRNLQVAYNSAKLLTDRAIIRP